MKITKKMIVTIALCVFIIALLLIIFMQIKKANEITEASLIKPKSITFDHSLDKTIVNQMILAARLYYTFLDTGEFKYLNAAIAPTFIDHTLPAGFPQGPQGQKDLSNQIRSAIPNLHCSIEDLLITGEMVTARLHFTGTSQLPFMGQPATGKPIEFLAIHILHIQDGKIVDEWHLEDKLALYQQLQTVSLKK